MTPIETGTLTLKPLVNSGWRCEFPNHNTSAVWCRATAVWYVQGRTPSNSDTPAAVCEQHRDEMGLAPPMTMTTTTMTITTADVEDWPLTPEEAVVAGGVRYIDARMELDGTIHLTMDGGHITTCPDPNNTGSGPGSWKGVYEAVMAKKQAKKAASSTAKRFKDGDPVKEYSVWELSRLAIKGGGAHVLLFGRQPGTGKTSWPLIVAGELGIPVFACNATEETAAAEPRGHFIHQGDEGFKFILGQATLAMTEPGLFLINEIDHSSPDLMSFWHAALDDPERALVPLPDGKGTIIKPKPGYRVVATMNGDLTDLPEPIRDRFQIKLHVDEVNPAAIEALDEDLRGLVVKKTPGSSTVHERHSARRAFAMQRARKTMGEAPAAQAIFGRQWSEVLTAIELARAPKEGRKKAA